MIVHRDSRSKTYSFRGQPPTRIRLLQEEKGLTLEDVENRGGPTWRHLIKVEKGKNHTVVTLLKIADALGVSAGSLLDK